MTALRRVWLVFLCVFRTEEKVSVLVTNPEIDVKRKDGEKKKNIQLMWVSKISTNAVLERSFALLSFSRFPKWR